MSEPEKHHHVRVFSTDDEQNAEIAKICSSVARLEDRISKLERWQAYTLGIASAVGTLVGLGLAIAGLVMK